MPIINPDTSEALDFSPLEPSTYKGVIRGVTPKPSSKGNPMIVVDWEVFVPGSNSRKRQSFLVTSGPGAYGFGQLLRATGFGELADKYADPAVQPKPPFDTDSLIGQEAMLVIESTIYEGQKRDQIASFLPA